jgi:hypothetical protein
VIIRDGIKKRVIFKIERLISELKKKKYSYEERKKVLKYIENNKKYLSSVGEKQFRISIDRDMRGRILID